MGLMLKVHFQKPGHPLMEKTVDIPVKFMENDEIRNLTNNGYYYLRTEVRAYP
jgi:hypothetical protein